MVMFDVKDPALKSIESFHMKKVRRKGRELHAPLDLASFQATIPSNHTKRPVSQTEHPYLEPLRRPSGTQASKIILPSLSHHPHYAVDLSERRNAITKLGVQFQVPGRRRSSSAPSKGGLLPLHIKGSSPAPSPTTASPPDVPSSPAAAARWKVLQNKLGPLSNDDPASSAEMQWPTMQQLRPEIKKQRRAPRSALEYCTTIGNLTNVLKVS